jgi:hypothetical protein
MAPLYPTAAGRRQPKKELEAICRFTFSRDFRPQTVFSSQEGCFMGNHPLEPAGNSSTPASQFIDGVLALQEAVRELLTSGWDDIQQRRAQALCLSLLQIAKQDRHWESQAILRALDSLLALSLAGDPAQRAAVGIKVAELVSLLKRSPTSRTA